MASVVPLRRHRWWILAVIGAAQLMVVLDATIVNIALPSAQRDLGFGLNDRQWVVTAYSLAFGSLLLLGGRLGDMFGRRRTFIAGLVGFALASAFGGAAQSYGMLIAARALQGAFGALLAPSALGLLTTTFSDQEDRGRAFAVFGGIASGGAAIGLLLGGMLTEWLSWRWCLYVNVLIAVPATIGAALLIRTRAVAGAHTIDLPGALSASGGLFLLVYGFAHAETSSWTNAVTLGSLALGVVLLLVFVAIESRVSAPLLPLRIVRDRNRGGAYLAILSGGLAMFAVFLFLTYYLQRTKGFSPIQTGLGFLPMVGALLFAAAISNTRLLPRLGPRPIVPVGMALGCVGMIMLTRLGVSSTYAGTVLPALLVLGLAFGFAFAPSINTATAGLPPADAGVGSAVVNTCQQVGGSLGTAALSSIFATALTRYAAAHPGPGALVKATLHGYSTAFWTAAGIFAAGSIVTALMFRSGPLYAPAAAEDAVVAG
ncbi:MAG TPA: MFS transporter [Solirubrobacteraceae bacterium]|nr:MFS transporter [Solirubrobacteraceae bacterium]